jgi:hypothetical protein
MPGRLGRRSLVRLITRGRGVFFLLTISACFRGGFAPPAQQDGQTPDSRLDSAHLDLAHHDRSDGDLATTGDLPQGPLCSVWGSTALFCEDMDSTGGNLPDSLINLHATGTLDTSRFYTGIASLRITTQDISWDDPFVLLDSPSSTAVATSGTVYLRAHYYFDSVPVNPAWTMLMESRGHSTTDNKIVVGLHQTGVLTLSYDTGQATGSLPLPVNRWFCVELEVTVDSGAGGARLWVDGQQVAQLTGLDTHQAVGHNFFRAGVIVSANTPPMTFNVDDFLVTPTRVGCP